MLLAATALAQDLSLSPEDLRIEQTTEGGYFLWVRQAGDIESVLLTESTEDPEHRAASYALRNPGFHPATSGEQRMLNGEFLPADHHSIVDSTTEPHPEMGPSFKLFIPYVVEYGYPGQRHGEILVVDGTYLSVRAFELDYASYQGAYRDNPFILRVTQKPAAMEPEAPATREYMDSTVREFSEIARESGGEVVYSDGEADVVDKIAEVIRQERGKSLDLVLALDTTKSMENDVPHLRASLVPLLEGEVEGFSSFRIGMVYYKDYLEDYLTETVEFQRDLSVVQRAIDGIRVRGGRDLPEAVHEALYAAVTSFPWAAESRLVILIGDAPPHARARGSITRELVYSEAKARGVTIHTMILPP